MGYIMSEEIPHGQPSKAGEMFKLIIAAAFLVGGIWAYDGVKGLPPYANIAFPVGGIIIALLIVFYWCSMGRNLIRYVKESTTEIKKVVWPKRPDTMRMTFFVLVFVAVSALFIYGVDSLITLLFNTLLVKG